MTNEDHAAERAMMPEAERRDLEWRIERAVSAAELAVSEYWAGDRAWAERWLLAAFEAGKEIR